MSCCGGKRSAVSQPETAVASQEQAARQQAYRASYVTFVYDGHSRLTVQGPYSRRRYRFSQPGMQLEVDRRDAPSLAAVPGLKLVDSKS